jgi:hypothetical protein
VVELPTQEAAAGLEGVAIMLEKAARDHTVLVRPVHLQVGIRALVSDPQPEGRSGDFLHVMVSVASAGFMGSEECGL